AGRRPQFALQRRCRNSAKSCACHGNSPMNGPHDEKRSHHAPMARGRSEHGGSDRGCAADKTLQDHPRGGRRLVWHCARQHHRAARRQRRRQDHHHCHDHGAGAADVGTHPGVGLLDARAECGGARPDELRKSLCRHAHAAHGTPESDDFRQALRRRKFARADRAARRRSRPRRLPGPRQRQTLRGPEDARGAGESADQPARAVVAGRTDGFARSRYRRLDPAASEDLSQDPWRDHPARVAQHAGGGAAVRPRHHHEARPHRGRRQPGQDHGPLQPGDAGGSVSRRRPRPRSGRCVMSNFVTYGGIAPYRIGAMILRYWYLLISSWPRLLELLYWPALQMITWGFLQSYISQNAGFFARAGGTLVGAVILWDILFRGQLGFSISFLEEMWARNLGNLMMSPLKPIEFLISLMIMSLIRLAIGVIPMTLLAMIFFNFNLYGIGLPLIAFFCNLIFTSWSVGIFVSGLVLRNGLGAESIVWTL